METNKLPRISIIVPCYNGERYLHETLDCLQKQTIDDWECIIVNDGSTDNSLEIIKEYAKKDLRYRYIDKENGGPAIARNIAIAASSGKYILPLDADDIIAPSYAEKAIEYLEIHSECKLIYCKAEYFGELKGKMDLPDYSFQSLLRGNMIFCSCIYRKSDFDRTIGYNPNMKKMHEDWDFLLSLLNEHDTVYCIPETLFFYRQTSSSRNHTSPEITQEAYIQLIRNHPDHYTKNLDVVIELSADASNYYKYELLNILNSKSYRLAKFFSKIIR